MYIFYNILTQFRTGIRFGFSVIVVTYHCTVRIRFDCENHPLILEEVVVVVVIVPDPVAGIQGVVVVRQLLGRGRVVVGRKIGLKETHRKKK